MCQFLADMLGRPVEVPAMTEATALGAACLAGISIGLFPGLEMMQKYWHCERVYQPVMLENERTRRYAGWRNAVEKLLRHPD